jgi:hypothetical protein
MTNRTSLISGALPIAIATVLFAAAPAAAQCIPQNFPNNWLLQQEQAGGHTIARHTGKTDQELVDRLAEDLNIAASSTYPSPASAQVTITGALGAIRVVLNNWANQARNGSRRVIDFVAADTVGRVAYRPADLANVADSSEFRVILQATGGGGCYLLTSYPTM